MFRKSLFLSAALVLSAPQLSAEMYRYIDESGQVSYSQFRPDATTETATVKAPPPPPSTADQSRQQLLDSLQSKEDKKEDMKEAEQTAAIENAEKQRQQKNCKAARYNLQAFTSEEGSIILDKKGKELKLSDFKRKQAIKKAREAIARDCKE